jgi:hypothetical protein
VFEVRIGLVSRRCSPTDCSVYECDREASIMMGPWPNRAVALWKIAAQSLELRHLPRK